MKLFIILVILGCLSSRGEAEELISIISPHRKSLQREFIPKFKEYYKDQYKEEIEVEWIDQGGSENDLKYIRSQFSNNNKTASIDVFWGGGDVSFIDLDKEKLLEKFVLPKHLDQELPKQVAGIGLRSKNHTWYASAMSSFGIFSNKFLLKMLNMPEPTSWADLAKAEFEDQIAIPDPRHSSTALMMFMIFLFHDNWDNGWKLLNSIAGNAKNFSLSSSAPVKAVVNGDAVLAPVVDFYANAKLASLGKDKVGFVLPKRQTVYNSDPVAILKGAPHRLQAERFIKFLLQADAQRLLILPKGHDQGPKWSYLGRMAINPSAYKGFDPQFLVGKNPFELAESTFVMDSQKIAKWKHVISDIIGAVFIDLHQYHKQARKHVIANNLWKQAEYARMIQAPISKAELIELSKKWENQSFRNNTILELSDAAMKKYKDVLRLQKKSNA